MKNILSSLFSVVIPCFNREKTICRAIDSIYNQTYGNIEIIVIDDGSTDSTSDLLNIYKNHSNFRYVYQKNSGAQVARNNGLSLANGEYIIFLDSDDWLMPTCLEKMVNRFENDSEVGAVYCLTGLKKNDHIVAARYDYLEGNIYKEVLKQGYLTSSSFISMRKSVFDVVGDWDVSFPASQDDDICFRIAKFRKIALVSEVLGIYGVDAGKGNKIGDSLERVSIGWFLLWEKYQSDIIELCGKEVYLDHIIENLYRFSILNNRDYMDQYFQQIYDLSDKNNYKKIIKRANRYFIFGKLKRLLKK